LTVFDRINFGTDDELCGICSSVLWKLRLKRVDYELEMEEF
jgi:hypothetical protein